MGGGWVDSRFSVAFPHEPLPFLPHLNTQNDSVENEPIHDGERGSVARVLVQVRSGGFWASAAALLLHAACSRRF
jgi:hypothetical protein